MRVDCTTAAGDEPESWRCGQLRQPAGRLRQRAYSAHDRDLTGPQLTRRHGGHQLSGGVLDGDAHAVTPVAAIPLISRYSAKPSAVRASFRYERSAGSS